MRRVIFQDLTPAFFLAVMMLLGLAIGSPTALSETDPSEVWKQKLPKPPIPVTEMQVTAYSKEFATRFGLQEPPPELEIKSPIYAMRFFIEILDTDVETQIPVYGCTLQVYLNNSLPIAYPREEKVWVRKLYAGRQQWYRTGRLDPNQPFLFPDRLLVGEKGAVGNMLVATGTTDFRPDPRRGGYTTHIVEAFDRDFAPGLSYLEIGLLCLSPHTAIYPAGLELWLKKRGAPDFRVSPIDFNAFLKFPIPKALLERTVPWLSWNDEYMKIAGEERARRGRERAAKSGPGPSPQVQQWLKELDDPKTARDVEKTIREMERRSAPQGAQQ